jgi:hypothetical protein
VDLRERCPVDDVALTMLHAAAFEETPRLRPWGAQVAGHSLTWVGAFEDERMVGFANLAWDGGVHAFLVDVLVGAAPAAPRDRRALAGEAVRLATEAGCAWLHADYAPDLAPFFADLTPRVSACSASTRPDRAVGCVVSLRGAP